MAVLAAYLSDQLHKDSLATSSKKRKRGSVVSFPTWHIDSFVCLWIPAAQASLSTSLLDVSNRRL